IAPCRLRGPFHASLPKTKFAADSALEGTGFEPCSSASCSPATRPPSSISISTSSGCGRETRGGPASRDDGLPVSAGAPHLHPETRTHRSTPGSFWTVIQESDRLILAPICRLAAGGNGPPTNDQAKKSGAVTPRDTV